MREHRKTLLENQVVFTYNGQSVKNNKYLPFTFNSQQMDKLVEESITTSSGLWVRDGEEKEKLPVEERYSYRDYDLKKVFNG